MEITDVGETPQALDAVRRTSVQGLGRWRCHGRLVAQ